ncbi:MAG: CPBP family glutamic-type intramembrane protease [Mongoliitalea sp.]
MYHTTHAVLKPSFKAQIKETIETIINFLKKPNRPETFADMTPKEFLKLLLITFLAIVPLGLLLHLFDIEQFDHKIEAMLENHLWLIVFAGIFIAPLLEEPVYRLHQNLKYSSLAWGFGLSFLLLSEVWYPLILFWVYLAYLFIQLNHGKQPSLKMVIWVSSILFGLVHMGNYTDFDYDKYFYLVPFLVGFQIVLGLILSYVRLTYGMKWAIIFHGAYNATLLIPLAIFYEP